MDAKIASVVDDSTRHGGAFLWHDGNDFVLLRRLANGAECTLPLPASMDAMLKDFLHPRIFKSET